MIIELSGPGVVCDVYYIDSDTFDQIPDRLKAAQTRGGASGGTVDYQALFEEISGTQIHVSKGFFADASNQLCRFILDDGSDITVKMDEYEKWAPLVGKDNPYVQYCDIEGIASLNSERGWPAFPDPTTDQVAVVRYTDFENGLSSTEIAQEVSPPIGSFRFVCNDVDCGGFVAAATYDQGIVGSDTTGGAEYAITAIDIDGMCVPIAMPNFDRGVTKAWVYRYDKDAGDHTLDYFGSKELDRAFEQAVSGEEEEDVESGQVGDFNSLEGDLDDLGVIDGSADQRETMFLVDHGVVDEQALIDLKGDAYLPYESRVPIELHNFSRALTAEANARFRIPLIEFINEVNEFTANRGFDDVYIDARVYLDENTPSNIIASLAVLVRVPEDDHLDTLSRIYINEAFEPSSPEVHESERVVAKFASLWGLDGLGASLVSELLARHFEYLTGAQGIKLTDGGMLNFEVNLMMRGLSHERFASASEDLERCESPSDVNIANLVSNCARILPIVESAEECDTETLKEKVANFIIEIAKVYRHAFGKGATSDNWSVSTSIDEAFCLDIGCCAIFKRDVLSGMVSLVTGSSALTFGALADQVLEELKIAFEFAEDDGEGLDSDRRFGELEHWYCNQLPAIEEVFCSQIRWNIDAFSRATNRVEAVDILSPWYWMSPQVRLHSEFINICRAHGLMVYEDMSGIPPIVRDRISTADS